MVRSGTREFFTSLFGENVLVLTLFGVRSFGEIFSSGQLWCSANITVNSGRPTQLQGATSPVAKIRPPNGGPENLAKQM